MFTVGILAWIKNFLEKYLRALRGDIFSKNTGSKRLTDSVNIGHIALGKKQLKLDRSVPRVEFAGRE